MCKFKKAIAVMLSAVMMLTAGSMPIAVNAATVESSSAVAEQTGTYNDFSYSINGTDVTITGYTGTETEIEIPSEINGCPVTSIGDSAFEKSELINIEIPDSVISLGKYAFYACENIEEIVLPDNIEVIPGSCFISLTKLKKVKLPANLKTIGAYAFYMCGNIEEIVLPDNIEVISEGCFRGLTKLKKLKLPANLKKIEAHAFNHCASLSEIEIPDKVTTIETKAFFDCTKIKSVTLPKGIQEIGGAAFGIYIVDQVYFETGKVKEFKIAGYRGTAAEEYANYYGFIFEDLTYIPMGDVNLDEDVSVLDVTMLQRYCTSTIELTDKQLSYADVDDNGSIDINDVTAIQRLIADHYAHI